MAAYEVLLGKTSSYDELDELVKQIGSWQDFKIRNPLCCLAVLYVLLTPSSVACPWESRPWPF